MVIPGRGNPLVFMGSNLQFEIQFRRHGRLDISHFSWQHVQQPPLKVNNLTVNSPNLQHHHNAKEFTMQSLRASTLPAIPGYS